MEERIEALAAGQLGLKPGRGGHWVAASIAREYSARLAVGSVKGAGRWFRREIARLSGRRFIGA